MWRLSIHHPDGGVDETYETLDEARAAADQYLQAGIAVTLAPSPRGLPTPHACSFCSKHRGTVAHFIAGPAGVGVAICNECVQLASEAFQEEASTGA